jgi:hypothetical protein
MSSLVTPIKLRTGQEVARPLVAVVLLTLRKLLDENPVLFYELVMLARDRNHQCFGNTGEQLARLGLNPMHSDERYIIKAAVEGEGVNMRLVSPYAEPAAG